MLTDNINAGILSELCEGEISGFSKTERGKSKTRVFVKDSVLVFLTKLRQTSTITTWRLAIWPINCNWKRGGGSNSCSVGWSWCVQPMYWRIHTAGLLLNQVATQLSSRGCHLGVIRSRPNPNLELRKLWKSRPRPHDQKSDTLTPTPMRQS